MERFVERRALKNVQNVSKNASVLHNRTVGHMSRHIYRHVKINIDDAGYAEFVGEHVSEC